MQSSSTIQDPATITPTQAPSTASGVASVQTTTRAPTPAAEKRKAKQVQVTIVTRLNFDPELAPFYLMVVEAKVYLYTKASGTTYNLDLSEQNVQNIDGKFAVVYNVRGASCDEVIAFVEAVSKGADVIERSTVKCDDHERIVFHASINSF
ncbi:unnamed protein product [Heligmosomoides polygyrus]|uniref:EKC/KEOPS complex subunit cgi121 n=1 Tax=Heligmosomoides polygyrus TaxID=6339 RepID=A0A183FIT1_HELPZ|nr:unnamed protein product [Heligmosomoides polygyrus]